MDEQVELISVLHEECGRWQALLAALDALQAALPTSPGRTVKDDVAHLAAWQERSIARLEAAATDTEPDFSAWPADLDMGGDAINEWVYGRNCDKPWALVLQEWQDGCRKLGELATAVPADAWRDETRYPWLGGYSLADVLLGWLDHHREHYEELRPLLAA